MKVFVLGLDGATWDMLEPLVEMGELPTIARLRDQGVSGVLKSVFPPLSPVAWTGVMTGKNSGKHGVFEFMEFGHDPLNGRVNSSRAIQSELVWEVAARYGKRTVAGAVPMSYPPRPAPGFYLGDFLSPANAPDFSSDPGIFAELEQVVGPYRPWCTSVHDGGRERETLADLDAFLDQHLRTVEFLMKRCDWDLFMYDLMATDRIQHELWHAWDPAHHAAEGRDLSEVRKGFIAFWRRLDEGVARIESLLPSDAALLLMSDHGFGPVDWYVNLNVWLLEKGYIALKDSFYVKQKHWFYKNGVTPESIYKIMTKMGLAEQRVGRFRGKQTSSLERFAESVFLSRRHIDWSKTRAYAQGNFGQIFVNQAGRQPMGCVPLEEVGALLDEISAQLMELPDPQTNEPMVDRVYRGEELYHGPKTDLAADLTVVLKDWSRRTIGLHDFTTNKVVSPSFGPTGDHRMEGILIASGPGISRGAKLQNACLLDVAPTILRLLGAPAPADMDGRILDEILDPALDPPCEPIDAPTDEDQDAIASPYGREEVEAIQKRLHDLGYV